MLCTTHRTAKHFARDLDIAVAAQPRLAAPVLIGLKFLGENGETVFVEQMQHVADAGIAVDVNRGEVVGTDQPTIVFEIVPNLEEIEIEASRSTGEEGIPSVNEHESLVFLIRAKNILFHDICLFVYTNPWFL